MRAQCTEPLPAYSTVSLAPSQPCGRLVGVLLGYLVGWQTEARQGGNKCEGIQVPGVRARGTAGLSQNRAKSR